ncbi:MAG: hypothetical protein EHM91_16030, partial [Planctomycetota bacterium]
MFQVYVLAMAGVGFVVSLLPPVESPELVNRVPLVVEQAICVVPDEKGRVLAEVGRDGTVALVRVDGVEIGRVPGAGQMRLVEWDGRKRAFALADERLQYARVDDTGLELERQAIEPVFDLRNPRTIVQAGLGLASQTDFTVARLDTVFEEIGWGKPRAVGAMAIGQNRGLLAYSGGGGRIVVEPAEGRERERRLLSSAAAVRSLAFDEDGDRLIGADEEGDVAVWDLATGRVHGVETAVFRPEEPAVLANGRGLLAVAGDEIRIRAVGGGTEERVFDDGFLCRVSRSWRRLTFGSCNAADLLTSDADGKRLAA